MRDRAAIPLRRMLALRQFPLFAKVELGELASLAEHISETTRLAGSELADRSLHLVLAGRIEARSGGHVDAWGPRDMFGLLEALARRPVPRSIVADDLHALRLDAGDFHDVLEDHFGLLRAVLRELSTRLAVLGEPRVTDLSAALTAGPLNLVERMIVLRQWFPFAGGGLQALAAVAQSVDEVNVPAGTRLSAIGDLVEDSLVVLAGSMRAGMRVLSPGSAIHALEAFAGVRHAVELVAVTPARVLRCSNATLLDVLEDHTDLGLAMITRFAGAVLDRANLVN
jgi:CRP-like cAMP-binding protein